MTRITAPRTRARLIALMSVGLLAAVLVAPASVAAADMTISQAESAMVAALNADRKAVGLVAFQVDTRLMTIARAFWTMISATEAVQGHRILCSPQLSNTPLPRMFTKHSKWRK